MANNRPPRDLNSLLNEIKSSTDFDRIHWGKQFREYLKTANKRDTETILDFVILAYVLMRKGEEIKTSNWKAEDLNEERRRLLKHIFEQYFDEDSKSPIALSNPVLREELNESLANLSESSGHSDIEEAYDLVWQARCDYKVWKAGVDRAYNLFLATKPSPTLTAVLMSIM